MHHLIIQISTNGAILLETHKTQADPKIQNCGETPLLKVIGRIEPKKFKK